jgi:FKBP-type peptidyl-prolyl cis-trans isomerase
MQRFFKYLLFIAVMLGFSCQNKKQQDIQSKKQPTKHDLLKANRYMVQEDHEIIARYIKRRGWDMKKTSSGLWYMIYEKGNGIKVEKKSIVKIDFEVKLLDGTVCYSSDSVGAKFFNIGKGDVEPGLEEGMIKLREGDKARFIMPPHLAHGLVGDRKNIPPYSIILYDIEVKKVIKKDL